MLCHCTIAIAIAIAIISAGARQIFGWQLRYLNITFVLAMAKKEVLSSSNFGRYMPVFLRARGGIMLAFFCTARQGRPWGVTAACHFDAAPGHGGGQHGRLLAARARMDG